VREPPLTDRELRILRGMLDDYENSRIMRSWFAVRWRTLLKVVTVVSAVAVTAAAIVEIIRAIAGAN
jgi:hypothetical protein